MRHTLSRSTIAGMIASKRIAVALCAAIAMVLGAMSVGASVRVNGTNGDAQTADGGSMSANIQTKTKPNTSPTTQQVPSNFRRQITLSPNVLAPSQSPILLQPPTKSKQSDTLKLGPVTATASMQTIELQVTAPLADPLNITTQLPQLIDTTSGSSRPADSQPSTNPPPTTPNDQTTQQKGSDTPSAAPDASSQTTANPQPN